MNSVELLPAITNTRPAPHLSERYVHVNSHEIVKAMEQEGFTIASIQAGKLRTGATRSFSPYAKHMIDFRHPDFPVIHGATPRMIFVNSHDGSTRAKALLGVFRFVCSNGMVIGSTFHSESVRHSGDIAKDLIDRVRALAKQTTPLLAKIDAWTKIDLSERMAREFATCAAQLRWGDPHRFPAESLLQVRREEDDRRDLWTVFNRIQEAAVRGGVAGHSMLGRAVTSRPVTEVAANLRFNQDLWQLAEEVAEVA